MFYVFCFIRTSVNFAFSCRVCIQRVCFACQSFYSLCKLFHSFVWDSAVFIAYSSLMLLVSYGVKQFREFLRESFLVTFFCYR